MRGRAVFLDRDGVLIEDRGLLTNRADVHVLDGVPAALRQLHEHDFRLIVVSNQAVVARGLLTEDQVIQLHQQIVQILMDAGSPALDAFYYCPHHPNATLPPFRVACECRKPRPGMLLQAAREREIDLERSVMIGDRMTDVIAGAAAGCRTILVETGAHDSAQIETPDIVDLAFQPGHRCASLAMAASWILATL